MFYRRQNATVIKLERLNDLETEVTLHIRENDKKYPFIITNEQALKLPVGSGLSITMESVT